MLPTKNFYLTNALLIMGFISSSLQASSETHTWNLEGIPTLCQKIGKDAVSTSLAESPWVLFFSPNLDQKKEAFYNSIGDTPNWMRGDYRSTGEDYLNIVKNLDLNKIPTSLTPALKEQIEWKSNPKNLGDYYPGKKKYRAPHWFVAETKKRNRTFKMYKKIMPFAASKICEKIKSVSQTACALALVEANNFMDVKFIDLDTVSFPDITNEVFTEPSYFKGVVIAAQKIEKYINNLEQGKEVKATNILKDLLESFQEAGLSYEEAEKHAWNVLGVFGSRGASLELFFNTYTLETDLWSRQYYYSLQVIFAGMTYIDGLITHSPLLAPEANNSANPYSTPNSLSGNCGYGKIYHYWLSAYLARHLVAKGFSSKEAIVGAGLIGYLYEMNSNTHGRDPKRIFTEGLYSSLNQSIRMNLSFNLTGVTFGAYSHQSQPELNVDQIILNHLNLAHDPNFNYAEAERKATSLMLLYTPYVKFKEQQLNSFESIFGGMKQIDMINSESGAN
ncbi:MAG: hypothetical protein ACOYL6_16665 [Bacteriovoracaceae bacterium]